MFLQTEVPCPRMVCLQMEVPCPRMVCLQMEVPCPRMVCSVSPDGLLLHIEVPCPRIWVGGGGMVSLGVRFPAVSPGLGIVLERPELVVLI